MTAVAILHRKEILEYLRQGKRLSDVSKVLGVSENAISKVLKDDPEYVEAIEQSFSRRIDKAEDAIQEAPEQVDVSRARAYHEAIKWRAGVEVPHRWGQRQDINIRVAEVALSFGRRESVVLEQHVASIQQLDPNMLPQQDDASD